MRSYIKIYGPPILKAIGALEKVAIDMPEVHIMNLMTQMLLGVTSTKIVRADLLMNYFGSIIRIPSLQRVKTIISKSGTQVGEYDFYFEWVKNPTIEEYHNLIEKVDNALEPVGCNYTITTK